MSYWGHDFGAVSAVRGSDRMSPEPSHDIPDGMSPDARETWPSPELINSWLGDQDVDFEFRPGEDVAVHDDPEAVAAARRFRDVLGRFASGVTVVTGDQQRRAGRA